MTPNSKPNWNDLAAKLCRHARIHSPRNSTKRFETSNNKESNVRKTDKSNVFVVMNTQIYQQKSDQILSDSTKFMIIDKDPTEYMKKQINQLIAQIKQARIHIYQSQDPQTTARSTVQTNYFASGYSYLRTI